MTKHKLIGIIFPFVLLITIFLPILSVQIVQAAPTPYSPRDTSKAYGAAIALSNCSNDPGWDKRQKGSDINEGEIFDEGSEKKVVGYLIDPSDDGEVNCYVGSDVKLLFEALDIEPLDLLKELDIYKVSGDAFDFNSSLSNEQAGNKIKQWTENKYGLKYPQQPKASQYIQLKAAWDRKCKDSKVDQNEGGIEVKVVSNTGEVTTEYWEIKIAEDAQVEVGYGITTNGAGDDRQMSCPVIAKYMNDYAADYANQVKENLDDDNPDNNEADTGEDASGLAPESCESQNTGIMDWVLCGVVNAIDSILIGKDDSNGTGGLLGIVSDLLEVDKTQYNDDQLKEAWGYFRNVATLALVLIGLVMVIGQAISKE